MKITVEGVENLPATGPLLIIGNHFSWYEIPLIYLRTGYQPSLMAAAELRDNRFLRFVMDVADCIPLHRGQVDRAALNQAKEILVSGGVVSIFPEGGIDPDTMALNAQGLAMANNPEAKSARLSAQLVSARPGAAYLAVLTGVPILPIACINTEKVEANVKRWRRTAVTMRIGRPFGPLTLDPTLKGPAKREALDALGDEMMLAIAALLPAENRGVYGGAFDA